MALSTPSIPLAHGTGAHSVRIPQLGVGTYKIDDADAERVVSQALALGYRHIDTAQMYGNETGVGRALAASGLERDEVFVTSKLNNPYHLREDALGAFERSLGDLGLEALDLFLVHWPLASSPGIDLVDTWRTMVEILNSGRVRAIGVSNFQPEHLERIARATGVVPAVNQVELHPWLAQRELRGLHSSMGVVTESWSPLARGRMLDDPALVGVARDLGVTPAQVIIRWHLQHGLVVIPKSARHERLAANADVLDFELGASQMRALDALDRGLRTGSHPDKVQL